ncbi:MAG: hypothetical protein CMH55_11020 [Myxococcales bacterium]|nr:hypothetical protein [Myxococcales bacterium]
MVPGGQRRLIAVLTPLLLTGCEDHAFYQFKPVCARQVNEAQALQRSRPVDILFVIDDSNSMIEEREMLASNISSPCGIDENPDDARCGFMEQLIAATTSQNLPDGETYFHIGVITTSLNANTGENNPGGVELPRFGCLFAGGSGIPVVDSNHGNHAITLVSDRIRAINQGGGDGFEQGLESMRFFLRGDTDEPACQDHLERFLRPTARLIVVFVTDEDDCSHRFDRRPPGMDATSCYVEQGGIPKIPVEDYVSFLQGLKADPDDIAMAVIGGARFDPDPLNPGPESVPCNGTIDCERGQICKRQRCRGSGDCAAGNTCSPSENEPGVSYCLPEDESRPPGLCVLGEAAGCNLDPRGTALPTEDSINPVNAADRCSVSGGGAGCPVPVQSCQPCFGDRSLRNEHPFCCEAEAASRYFEVTDQLFAARDEGFLYDSICSGDYRGTLRDIASLLVIVPEIELLQPPADPAEMRVEVLRRQDDGEMVREIVPYHDPDGGELEGWDLTCARACQDLCTESGTCARRWLRFHGDDRPRPGDRVETIYLTQSDEEVCSPLVGSSQEGGGP